MYYVNELVERIIKSERIIIYGAHVVAKEVTNCLCGSPYYKNIEAYVVTDKDGNPDQVLGKPVVTIEYAKNFFKDALIIVAVLDKYLCEIRKNLEDNDLRNYICCGFESDLWSEIRGNYFRELCIEKYGEYKTLEESILGVQTNQEKEIHLYVAKCHVDKELANNKEYPWERQIQVGTSLTEQIVCDVRDNIGENISNKNREYCELTALFWIWKNDKADYAGLSHYRRHFELTKDMLMQIGNSDIDVVLTIPILNFPSVRATYENDHLIEDWDIMLQVLDELHADYYKTALEFQEGIYYYAYNMFIARKEIFDEYCEWLFPILFECERRCKEKQDAYQARYIGFLAERLLSIFFLHNWNRWNIVHAKKNFLS